MWLGALPVVFYWISGPAFTVSGLCVAWRWPAPTTTLTLKPTGDITFSVNNVQTLCITC